MSRNPLMLAARTQIETPEFKSWFGDSKVVDPSGRPLVVYHGTRADFAVFDGGKAGAATQAAWSEMGHFFTEDPSLASDFTKGKNWAKPRSLPRRGANVMPVFLAIMFPMYVTAARALPMSGSVDNVRALRAEAVASGHDGIVIEPFRQSFGFDDTTHELVVPQYIAFRPEQIKSVFNRGDFDPASPNICMSGVARERAR